ncbi:MAG TPA: class I SAM-dependent methyltransferase [Proteobacteria bacterium]|nr:class I SAM-dependent methyltransferase [Pseudomonadota bacterium]
MKVAEIIESLLSNPLVYRLHAAGVDRPKLAAIRKLCSDYSGLKVLDLGCGPGNTAHIFSGADYTGVDINERYISVARKKHPGLNFIVGDVNRVEWGAGFDIILINSLLHHLDDNEASKILRKAVAVLKETGKVIIQEPMLPGKEEWSYRLMMRLDRGNYFRSLPDWKYLLEKAGLSAGEISFYHLRVFGFKNYHMVSMLLERGRQG